MTLRISAAVLLCAATLAAADGPVLRPDHVVVSVGSADDAQKLQQMFTEGLGLPAAWPVQKYGIRTSGGIWLGNFALELAVWPQVEPYQFLGLAMEVRDTEAAYAELRARGLRVRDQDPVTAGGVEFWRKATIPELAGEGLGIFLCRYNPAWMGGYAEKAKKSFAMSGGGKAGVIGVASIEVGVNAARREAVQKMIAPLMPEELNPKLVLVDGRYQIRQVQVRCREPEKAKGLLPPELGVVFTK